MKKIIKNILNILMERWSILRFDPKSINKINLCCGSQIIPGYFGIDINGKVDLKLNLEKRNLPFKDSVLDVVTCTSAINYFTRSRGQEIINEVYRTLKIDGVARFSVQDLESIARRYVEKDYAFFFQKLPDGRERFEGPTLGDKFAAWFYGYASNGVPCRYFYDYDSLANLFKTAGFSVVEKKEYLHSRLDNIDLIDNRPDQMFFLEAIK